MAFRVRVIHSLALGLIGMALLLYTSYSQDQTFTFSTHTSLSIHNGTDEFIFGSAEGNGSFSSISSSSSSLALSPSPQVFQQLPPQNLLNSTNQEHAIVKSQVVEPVISPSVASSTSNNNFKNTSRKPDAIEKGVLTSSLYEPGYYLEGDGLCPENGSAIQLLIMITSAPGHKSARKAIRYTWGSFGQRKDVDVGFIIGRTLDPQVEKELRNESDLYGDIVAGNFLDSYNNLTLKTISMLEWVDSHCPKTRFILKTDDDMFINVPRLIAFISKHEVAKRTIFGRLARKWSPVRNSKSKYYVSPNQYKPHQFPDFTTGPAYLLTGDVINDLYRGALAKTYLKLEDVMVTGIVAQEQSFTRVHVNQFFNKRTSLNPCIVQRAISIHMIKFHEQFDLWKKLLDERNKCKV